MQSDNPALLNIKQSIRTFFFHYRSEGFFFCFVLLEKLGNSPQFNEVHRDGAINAINC